MPAAPSAMPFTVLYEDNHLIAVNKPSGILVQGDQTGDMPLLELVKGYIKEKYRKPGEVFLGTIHRLDRPVSGIVVFARTSKALERMNELFRTRYVQKTYWAITRRKPPHEQGILTHWLVKDTAKNRTTAHVRAVPDGLFSELSYRLVAAENGYYLLEVNPLTGRPHQIRVQLASMQCPIVGDVKYGYAVANPDKSICLHARQLQFVHPVQKTPLTLQAPIPNNNFWNQFTRYAS